MEKWCCRGYKRNDEQLEAENIYTEQFSAEEHLVHNSNDENEDPNTMSYIFEEWWKALE